MSEQGLKAIRWVLALAPVLGSCNGLPQRSEPPPSLESEEDLWYRRFGLPGPVQAAPQLSVTPAADPSTSSGKFQDPSPLEMGSSQLPLGLLGVGALAAALIGAQAFRRYRRRNPPAPPAPFRANGKKVAIACGLIAILTLVLGAIGAKEKIVERWYLGRLDSEDLETRIHAIVRLGELRSEPAIPSLVKIVGREGADPEKARSGYAAAGALLAIGRPGISAFLDESAILLFQVLRESGEDAQRNAVELAMEWLESPDFLQRWEAANLLKCVPKWGQPAVPALRAALKDKEWLVRESSAEALARILASNSPNPLPGAAAMSPGGVVLPAPERRSRMPLQGPSKIN